MIKSLAQLTVSRFIDMICGNHSVLLETGETASAKELAMAASSIVSQYKEISDSAGMKRFISRHETRIKAEVSRMIYSMCINMNGFDGHERVRQVLEACGINAHSMSRQRVEAEVKSRYERARRELLESSRESHEKAADEEAIRRDFDAQTASLMAHFRFCIDHDTMKANLYAHLVERQSREVKAQLEAMKKI